MTLSRLLLLSVLLTGATVGVGTALSAPPPIRQEVAAATVADDDARRATVRAALRTAGGARHDPGARGLVPLAAQAEALAVLQAWDEQRARAWAQGDLGLLRSLYTPLSRAGARDRSMLHRWTDRGLVDQGLRTELLDVEVLEHSDQQVVMVVTDRVHGGTAVGDGLRRPLPADRPTTRLVTLRQVGGAWRVASVRPYDAADRPAATTASTSGSAQR